ASGLAKAENRDFDPDALSSSVLPRGEIIEPRAGDIKAYHGDGGYLSRLENEYEKRR
ncbi:MAG: hypothetical protein HN368_01680, partial [Spirochaetales bacterium]|nr:hypothetical protein [Spirochaetales bacterium]